MVRADHERRQPESRGCRLERVGQSANLGRRTDIEKAIEGDPCGSSSDRFGRRGRRFDPVNETRVRSRAAKLRS